jgi:hypothetical protein
MLPLSLTVAEICGRCSNRMRPCAGPCPCTVDGRDVVEHVVKADCPLGFHRTEDGSERARGAAGPALTPEQQAEAAARLAAAGRLLWAELHTQRKPTPDWWAGWLSRVGKLGCSCRGEAQKIIEQMGPPPLDDPVAMFFYGWDLHNRISRKLGKAEVTREAAVERWGREDVV